MTPDTTPIPAPMRRSSRHRETTDLRLRVLSLVGLAVAQAVVVGVTGSGITRIVAVALLIPSLASRIRMLSALAAFIVVNFVVHSLTLPPSLPWRLAHLAVFAAYAAVGLAALIDLIARVRFAQALILTGGLGALFLASDVLAGTRVTPVMRAPRYLTGTGNAAPDEVFGGVYRPYGEWLSQYPDDLQGYLAPPASTGERARGPFTVAYSTNALGCRGRDAVIPNRRTERRVLILGGSSAFGIGVREEDTLAEQLARRLNTPAGRGGPVVVLNCALAGAGTHDQRMFYEQVAGRYEADVVLLVMSERDNLSARDDISGGYVHTPGSLEAWFTLVRLLQWSRHEGRRAADYGPIGDEVKQLHTAVETRRGRLVVAQFRIDPLAGPWSDLQAAVTRGLAGTGVPSVDLGSTLTASPEAGALRVHVLDPRPNHRAHALAAEALVPVLARERLLD